MSRVTLPPITFHRRNREPGAPDRPRIRALRRKQNRASFNLNQPTQVPPMNPKLSQLLAQRPGLLRQVRLANLAFAYQSLNDFAARIARVGLHGRVTLKPVDPDAESYCVTLTALDTNQSLIEEHFSDEDLVLLA